MPGHGAEPPPHLQRDQGDAQDDHDHAPGHVTLTTLAVLGGVADLLAVQAARGVRASHGDMVVRQAVEATVTPLN